MARPQPAVLLFHVDMFGIDDRTATCAAYASRGVEFEEPPTEYPWGFRAMLEDPDGNTIILPERTALRDAPEI